VLRLQEKLAQHGLCVLLALEVDRLLVDVEMGASDELLLLIKQSFRDETVVTLLRPEWKLE
jgi:hypothetical protein